ncbi:MAG: TrkH family potassium uptake protein, partial [Bradymonadaceae bacterium]
PRDAYELTRFIVVTTFVIESIGAVCLAGGYLRHGYAAGPAIWNGVFHAVSAFCNAGFALQSDSIVMFQHDPLILGVVGFLIVLGGIGFVVMATASTWLTEKRRPKFAVQTRVILCSTVALVVGGAILYGACEWSASLGGMSVVDRLANALFQSVTLRTAGFNSVEFEALTPATALVMMAFMFVGASPGSTAGGIKTTTAAFLVGAVGAIARGETRVVFFGRRIPQSVVYRSAAIASVTVFILLACAFSLLLLEDIGFLKTLFEAFSALGTVGLSLGATSELHAPGKVVVTATMFLGRVGPLTLALLLGGEQSSDLSYPAEDIMVG